MGTETIGTYTDVDGNVETEVHNEECHWSNLGSKQGHDVYQVIDQTKIIPINSAGKHRREALASMPWSTNEVVDDATDSSLLTLVADLTTRVTALESLPDNLNN